MTALLAAFWPPRLLAKARGYSISTRPLPPPQQDIKFSKKGGPGGQGGLEPITARLSSRPTYST
jgi:hypothetical protein